MLHKIQKEQRLREKIERALPGVAESLVLRFYSQGQLEFDLKVGKEYQYYDLASLTKMIFTNTAVMRAKDQKKLSTDYVVARWLKWFPDETIRIRQLLNHTSGLMWWKPFYEKLHFIQGRTQKRERLREFLAAETLDYSQKSIYSDLGFMTLGFVLENLYQEPLERIWETLKWEIGAESFNFHLDNTPIFARESYAPTEVCSWRNMTLQGEVHDDNAWSMGGIAPHAGLFGSIEDVSHWLLHLRSVLFEKQKWIVSKNTLEKFITRSIPEEIGDFGLGFVIPTEGKASCGKYFSAESFGHTGFTGTSFWMDPRKDIALIMLTNRTYPSRENKKFVELRPQIHNWVYEEFFG